MNRSQTYRVTLLLAALVLALTSFASAARMAPSDADSPQVSAFIAMGGALEDICGDDLHDHGADCPFCQVTAETRTLRPVGHIWQIVPVSVQIADADLTIGEQGVRSAWSARATPHAV